MTEKPDKASVRKILANAFSEISRERRVLNTLWVGSIFIGIFSLIKPFTVQVAINNLFAQNSSQIISIITFFAFFILLNIATYIVVGRLEQVFYRWFSISRAFESIFYRETYFDFDDEDDGSARSRKVHHFLDLSFQNAQQVPVVASTMPPIIIQTVFGLFYISLIHPFLFMLTLIFFAQFYFVIFVWSPRALWQAIEYHEAKQDIIFKTARYVSRIPTAQLEIDATVQPPKAVTFASFAESERQSLVDHLDEKQSRFLRTINIQSRSIITATAIGNIALLATGLWLVLGNEMTLAQLVAAEIAFAPALFGAFQSNSNLSTTYEVISNLHLMKEARRQNRTNAGEPSKSWLPVPEAPIKVIGKSLRPERTFISLGIAAAIGIVLILLYVPWVQTITVEGQVIALDPAAREHMIESPYEGLLQETYAEEGDEVDEGQTLAELASDDGTQKILAPSEGTILESLVHRGSSFLTKGEPAFRFMPRSEMQIIRFRVPAEKIYLIGVGDQVVIRFAGWPDVQFSGWPPVALNRFEGRVRFVSTLRGRDSQFYVDVEPNEDADFGTWPIDNFAGRGAPAEGIIRLKEVPVGYELWRLINGFPKSID